MGLSTGENDLIFFISCIKKKKFSTAVLYKSKFAEKDGVGGIFVFFFVGVIDKKVGRMTFVIFFITFVCFLYQCISNRGQFQF